MPLFVCSKCGYIENTALTACGWTNYSENKPMICSKCCHGCKRVSPVRKKNLIPNECHYRLSETRHGTIFL
jgi:hypothetical protein